MVKLLLTSLREVIQVMCLNAVLIICNRSLIEKTNIKFFSENESYPIVFYSFSVLTKRDELSFLRVFAFPKAAEKNWK